MGYRVGEWTIDPHRGLASRQDEQVHLEPKATELLNHLAARSGEVVSRSELLDAVWPDVTVGDEVITNAVAKLRKALGDDPKSPTLIETIPKRGYRIVARVDELPSEYYRKSPARIWAILMTAALAALIALFLGDRQAPVPTGAHQPAAPNAGSPQPPAAATAPDPRVDPAYRQGLEAYRRGTPEGLIAAIGHLEQAIMLDPAHGPSLATLAAIYLKSYRNMWHRRLGISPQAKTLERAKTYLERAQAAPTPLAHRVAAAILILNQRHDEALAEARAAIALDPNAPDGHLALSEVLTFAGSADQAERSARKAMALDPVETPDQLLVLGLAQLGNGRPVKAIQSLERASQRVPDDRMAVTALISAYGTLGKLDEAKAALAALNTLQHRDKLVAVTIPWTRERWPHRSAGDRDRFLDGLRKAGMPEW